MFNDQVKGVSHLEDLKLEDDMMGRKNAIKRYLTRYIPKYLVDIVLQFLGTRDYSSITKPKCTIQHKTLRYPHGVSFIKQKFLAVGYFYGQVAIWDIKSQKLIRVKKFNGTCTALLTFQDLLLVCLRSRGRVVILDSNLEKRGELKPKLLDQSEGIAVSEQRGWIAISDCYAGVVKFFELQVIGKKLLEPIAVIDIAGLNYPTGICFNLDGSVLAVCERRANQISLFNPLKKEKLLSFGTEKLSRPNDVKLDTDGNFLVYDTSNRRLCIFDQGGTFLLSVLDGFFRDSGNTFSFIGVDSSGTIAVSDDDNHQVFIF